MYCCSYRVACWWSILYGSQAACEGIVSRGRPRVFMRQTTNSKGEEKERERKGKKRKGKTLLVTLWHTCWQFQNHYRCLTHDEWLIEDTYILPCHSFVAGNVPWRVPQQWISYLCPERFFSSSALLMSVASNLFHVSYSEFTLCTYTLQSIRTVPDGTEFLAQFLRGVIFKLH